jgi:heterotetrameric sarcosine oxidase gamma subunit
VPEAMQTGGVKIAERTGLEMAQVSAWPETSREVSRILGEFLGVSPPERPNGVANQGQQRILWLGPDRWLIVRPAENENLASELVARLPSEAAAVVESGAGRCVFIVSGPRARDVLAKLLPLDLSAAQFPVGSCAQSAMAHIGVLVCVEGEDVFEIFVYRGFGRYFWEILCDASPEFGLDAY